MNLNREKAKENLSTLVQKFREELVSGRAEDYNEEATKISFIQPLLQDVLGWDVRNRDEVRPEVTVSRGRVDYGLRIEGMTKLFLEVKPIRADLARHIEQAVRYGYNKKSVHFVLLTDFEELKLFDVTVRPDTRNPLKGVRIDLRWDQYLQRFEELWLLSKESVEKGELDKLLLMKRKERLPVDKAILDDLRRWRVVLAKEIFRNNPGLFHSGDREKDANYLKEITQRILDRVIFMRSCEDRGLVHRRRLKELFEERTEAVGASTMIFLGEELKHYNIIFDSDLFSREEWEENLAIDFKVMQGIVLETYNPYQFDVIPLDVLGNIYEQYLGYTARLTDHQVKFELKPEVRRAGGVYYTPQYVVDYIVKNTVGRLLEELPRKKIKKLRILDPACGSGSFLIRAYEEMLYYYRRQKKHQPNSGAKQEQLQLKHEGGEPQLTILEKSEVLRNHIFGVDLDEQAVEVTKLSLMLKMLEGESGIIPGRSILPMLDRNIRCRNSLISGDTLELKKYFGDEWYKMNPLNWTEEFRKIVVEEGGFDVVIGNPPWLMAGYYVPNAMDYFRGKFKTAKGKFDLYYLFIEQGCRLLSGRGVLGMIVPNKFFHTKAASNLRLLLSGPKWVRGIVDFADEQVFSGATNYSCILLLQKQSRLKPTYIRAKSGLEILQEFEFPWAALSSDTWSFIHSDGRRLFQKLDRITQPLGSIVVRFGTGVQSGADRLMTLDRDVAQGQELETDLLRPIIRGRDVRRYANVDPEKVLIFPYKVDNSEFLILSERELQAHKAIYKVLLGNKKKLANRVWFGKQAEELSGRWYGLMYLDSCVWFSSPHILTPSLSNRCNFALGTGDLFVTGTAGVTSIVPKSNIQEDLLYFLALLNSRLMNFYAINHSPIFSGGYYKFSAPYLKNFPIRRIDFSDPAQKRLHSDLVTLVGEMLDMHKKAWVSKGTEKEQIQRQIEKTDKEIDGLVYLIYGITEEERRVIEGLT